jgi:hypothetical protein
VDGPVSMKLLIRGGSIAAGHGVKKCYADILKESLIFDNPNDMDAVNSFLPILEDYGFRPAL